MNKNLSNQITNHFVGGNYFDKYRSKNPIHRFMMDRFLNDARLLLKQIHYQSILELGCGPGDLAAAILPSHTEYLGVDLDPDEITTARKRYPYLTFEVESVYNVACHARSFDLVLACEVLEYLEDPARALAVMDRVGKEWFLLSAPWEPIWRVLNIARGKYWSRMGNTPGHIQHFSRKSIRKLVLTRFEIVQELHPFPWTMILAKKR